jgi:hypothetical protein
MLSGRQRPPCGTAPTADRDICCVQLSSSLHLAANGSSTRHCQPTALGFVSFSLMVPSWSDYLQQTRPACLTLMAEYVLPRVVGACLV